MPLTFSSNQLNYPTSLSRIIFQAVHLLFRLVKFYTLKKIYFFCINTKIKHTSQAKYIPNFRINLRINVRNYYLLILPIIKKKIASIKKQFKIKIVKTMEDKNNPFSNN
jgi:hypothetical protein